MKRMLSICALGFLAVLSALWVAPVAAATSTTITLKLADGHGGIVQGDSTVPGHLNEIIVLTFNFSHPIPLTNCDFFFIKNVDRASPTLLLDSFSGALFPDALFFFLDTSARTPKPLFTITLRPTFIHSYKIAASAGAGKSAPAPTEEIDLSFTDIEFRDEETGITHSWNCATDREP